MIWLLVACWPNTSDSGAPSPVSEICGDGEDNDGNGLIDCVDPACRLLPECIEDCGDGVDNDQDGYADCEDADCAEAEGCVEVCGDGADNDSDGLTDCEDPDCASLESCQEDCADGLDNDSDGLADCEDPDCSSDCPEDCLDGQDNDADGLIDCEDRDCTGVKAPCIEVCDDGLDNDLDGTIDCRDPDCRKNAICLEHAEDHCSDGIDNDGDGLVDCEDAACHIVCLETECSDGLDNDQNGLADCQDPDCWGLVACPDAKAAFWTGDDMVVDSTWGGGDWSGYVSWSSDFVIYSWTDADPTGLGWVLRDGVPATCSWSADRLFARYYMSFYNGVGGSSEQLLFTNLQSSGGCSGAFSGSALDFQEPNLDGERLVTGWELVIDGYEFGAYSYAQRQPWVIGVEP